MKSGWKCLALATSQFDKFKDENVPTVAVLSSLDGQLVRTARFDTRIDDIHLTRHLAEHIREISWLGSANLIAFSAITFAGLGIVDIQQLNQELGIPVLLVNRVAENTSKIEAALAAAELPEQRTLNELGLPITVMHVTTRGKIQVHLRSVGMKPHIAVGVTKKMLVVGHVPQPIRAAQCIAKLLKVEA